VFVTLAGDRGLHWRCTARQNFEYFLGLKGFSKREIKTKIEINENIFGSAFKELVDKRVETMSFGQKKKISLFLSFISGADYLVFDEITEGIDVDSREYISTISESLKKNNKALIYATHDISFANAVSDEVILIVNGTVQKIIKVDSETDLAMIYKLSE